MTDKEVKITITALGLRNLVSSAKKPILKFKLTNGADSEVYTLEVNEKRVTKQDSTCNPYILNTIEFTAKVADTVSDWPYLQVSLTDEGWFGCKNGYTTLLLFPYATFLAEADKKATFSMFNAGVEVSKTRTRAGTTKRGSSLGSKLSHRSLRTISGSHRSSRSSRSAVSSVRSWSVIVQEDDEDDEDSSLEKISENDGEEEKKVEPAKPVEEEPEIKLHRVDSPAAGAPATNPMSIKAIEDSKTLAADQPEEEKALLDIIYQMHFEEFDTIQCTKSDKRTMRDEAELLVNKLDNLRKDLLAVLLLINSLK